ncbi:CotZ-related putative spore coat protein [Sporosarcina sp. FSL K6-1522]|uniref:CotZ-related putative spore coat protein n=1 Tax=Sporosarcina sp. FSL K6-1522 TaxID=2921554 RepID=UPI00315A3CEF
MPNWMMDRLKEIDTVNQQAMNPFECQTAVPFMLVGRDGTPFTVFGFSRGCFFKSRFFTVHSIHGGELCVVLEVLAPCDCNGHLFRTKAKVVVNSNRFCGLTLVDVPVFDYLQVSYVVTDQLCLPFMLCKKDVPKTIYRLDGKEQLHAETVSVHYTGTDPQVELTLYTKEKSIRLQVPKDEFRSLTVCQLQSIEIATPVDVVKGMIELQLHFCEKKKLYF